LHESQLNFKLLAPLGITSHISLGEIPSLYGLDKTKVQLPTFLAEKLYKNAYKLVLHPKSKGSARE